MNLPQCHVQALFIGGPKTLVDGRGEWRSSIARDRVEGPAQLDIRGFAGDQATQPYHGSPESAVCLHAQSHYDYWNASLGMNLQAGAVGENLTLDAWDDSIICVGDVMRIGTAVIQVSGPRIPCENQARHVGRPDWVKLTLQALRTGFYARVLEEGLLQVGDEFMLEARPNPGLTIRELNRCTYHSYDDALAERYFAADGLEEWWKERLRRKGEKAGRSQTRGGDGA